MSRVRLSTTVDGALLAACRRLAGSSDSRIIDRALAALLESMESDRERAALGRHPYDADPELAWDAPAAEPLPYDGEIPEAVLDLARRRRG